MDHWVDIVAAGYPESGFRVQSDAIHATFMVYEIIIALNQAAEMTGIPEAARKAIFHDNGMEVLSRVREGQVLSEKGSS